MNKLFTAIIISFIVFSCYKEERSDDIIRKKGDLIIDIDLQNSIIYGTKAYVPIGANDIQSLHMLLFDELGNFISLHEGVLVSPSNPSQYKFTGVLLSGAKDRILHFIANYNWGSFNESNQIGINEKQVINALESKNGLQTYWQKVLISGGFNKGKGETYIIADNVHLLRNMAKINIVNKTVNTSQYYITDVSFGMGDYYNKGTVAPFNTTTTLFDMSSITESPTGTPQTILESDLNTLPKLIYERKNSTAARSTYIIIKAKFQKLGFPANNTTYSYYKIDIADANADKLLDLQRNYSYIININNVLKDGYSTLQLAMQNAASNNINASVTVSEYTSISDGSDVLNIEKSTLTLVQGNTPFSITYSYVNGATGLVDNTGVQITLTQDAANPVVNGNISYTTTTSGTISGTTANMPSGNNINTATITVSKGSLKRNITLRLRQPMSLSNLSFFAPAGGNVANLVAQPCIITFKFPSDIPITDYPIPIYIYSKKLSPDPIIANSSLISVDTSPSANFRYIYMAPYLGFDSQNQPIPHYIQFVTNSSSSNEVINIGSTQFSTSSITLNTLTTLSQISNLSFSPSPAAQVIGTQITVKFTMPNISYATAPYTIRIFTSRLDFVSTSTGTSCIWDSSTKSYIYTTNSTGLQTIIFKTNSTNNTEVIRVGGDKFGYLLGSRS